MKVGDLLIKNNLIIANSFKGLNPSWLPDDDEDEDYFNIKRKRNENNTDYYDYNCGGYAFKTFSWYQPFNCSYDERLETITKLLLMGFKKEQIFRILLKQDEKIILNDFKGRIKEVKNANYVPKENEILIAYRLRINSFIDFSKDEHDINELTDFLDYDYHFIVKENGAWNHKRGELPPESTLFTTDVWSGGYDSPIKFFALKIFQL